MDLWRVDVCGVSHRYVEAETREDAEQAVRNAIVSALDLRAVKAASSIAATYRKAGPLQRKNLLAHVDGLTNPRERRSARSAKRQLERMAQRDEEERAWIAGHRPPPASPEMVDFLVRMLEIGHVEESLLRLPEWERHSPIHGK